MSRSWANTKWPRELSEREAEAEAMAHFAAFTESEHEAEAMAGAAVSATLSPRDRRALRPAGPDSGPRCRNPDTYPPDTKSTRPLPALVQRSCDARFAPL